MLGMYLTTAVNFLADSNTPTISGGMDSIWSVLGQAMMKVKEAIYAVLPHMELKSIDVSNDEIYFQQEREQILEKVKSFYENKLAEKDKEYRILLADRDKLEMYRHNRLKKSDITLHYIECSECESEEFCDDNNLFKVVNEFEHDENCSDYGNILNLDIRCIIKYEKYENLEE